MDKELKEFWEACGFINKSMYPDLPQIMEYPNGETSYAPELTFENLKKYAIPKISNYRLNIYKAFDKEWEVTIYNADNDVVTKDNDFVTALYEALKKVLL